MRIYCDMSSLMWTSLRAGKDVEGYDVMHNGKTVHVNSAGYGQENIINLLVKAMGEVNATPKDLVMVYEGTDSKKRRCMIDPMYKGNRDGDKCPEAYIEFNKLKEALQAQFHSLGAIALSQPFVEGDDVIGWLVEHSEEDHLVLTNDNDLAVLNGFNKQGAHCQVRVNGEVGKNKYGDFDFKLITLYKATVGDASDSIKGCPGFGPVAFLQINSKYDDDGCFELMKLIADGKRDALAQTAVQNKCSYLQKIVDNWESVVKSYKLALLHPEWIDTVRVSLDWNIGVVLPGETDERLKKWSGQRRLLTPDNFGPALAFLKSKLSENPEVGFDIETSTPEESDDWLVAQGNPDGVDVFGSYLVSYSLTFGANNQYTYYLPIKHRDTANLTMVQARQMAEAVFDAERDVVIQNTSFELSVLYQAQDEDGSYWRDHWMKYGQEGFVPRVLDTLYEGSYFDENFKLGLKARSQGILNYDQADFKTTMSREGEVGTLPKGGRVLKTWADPETEGRMLERRIYKMHEVTAKEAFDYGCDDPICTLGLHNGYKLKMQTDHHWDVYKKVELAPTYLHAKSFVDGIDFSLAKMKELETLDGQTHAAAWGILRTYLIENGWTGTVPPTYTAEITVKEIKEAYSIVTGLADEEDEDDEDESDDEESTYHAEVKAEKPKDPFLSTRVRTPAKLIALLRSEGHDVFAEMLEQCLKGKHEEFTTYVRRYFKGEPQFKFSNKQLTVLLYEKLKLPIRLRGKPTAKMKAAGIYEGNPKANAKAVDFGMLDADEDQKKVLSALKLLTMVKVRFQLYYNKYPYLIHWKDGKIHSSHNQCATVTRRASSSGPNVQQLPKHPKVEGQAARFRETFVAHHADAVVVSMDFASQELRIIAEYSQDPALLACYVGVDLKDMHLITGHSIALMKVPAIKWTYDEFKAAYADEDHEHHKVAKKYRGIGKTTNFAVAYDSGAETLGITMLVSEAEAQSYIDAYNKAFPGVKAWKMRVVEQSKQDGVVLSMCGAKRHLAKLLNSEDRYIASKAERQGPNFKVQGSAAEMTKLAEGRMWEARLLSRFDCRYIGPVHDECVFSVAVKDLVDFLVAAHACMVESYADMKVPIESSISFGKSFGEQVEIGNLPDVSAIVAGLAKVDEAYA